MKLTSLNSFLVKSTSSTTLHVADVLDDYTEEEALVIRLLRENLEFDQLFSYNRASEWYHFLQFTSSMISAFPIALLMRMRIRKNKRLNYILQFNELLQVRNNIEKGSFAYDTILFEQSSFQLIKNKSHLANLVCLAILFGDEFIDGIATIHGKKNIQTILNNKQVDYYLHFKKTSKGYELYYAFDICEVLPKEVLESINPKYNITYRAFYGHLQFLLSEMNLHLYKLNEEVGEEAAQLICKACNKCFDTYKADINEFNENYSLQDLLQYQKTKDDDIIQVLLTLRAVLLGKKQLQYQKNFSSWSSMVRSMQLYDDMQDVATDCNFQMNILCFFSKNYFPEEWVWLQQNRVKLEQYKGLHLHAQVSLFMPASCMLVMQFARNIANTKLSWVQRKIQNYLWCKNWLGFNNQLLNPSGFCLSSVLDKNDFSIPLKFHFIQQRVFDTSNNLLTDDMKWSHMLDISLMDEELKLFIFDKISRKEKYKLISFFVELPISEKATLLKRVLEVSNINFVR